MLMQSTVPPVKLLYDGRIINGVKFERYAVTHKTTPTHQRKQPPAVSCANYTRALMLVFDKFWRGEMSMQQLREQERLLCQQLLIKIEEYYGE